MSYQGGRAFAAPATSVYTTHPDGGFGPGYEGEYVTAPAAPIAGHGKYGSFMQVMRIPRAPLSVPPRQCACPHRGMIGCPFRRSA
jgi:hypothetical protein